MSWFETKEEKIQRRSEEANELGQSHGSKRMGVWEEINAKPLYDFHLESSDVTSAESDAYDAGWKNGRKQRT